MLGCRFASPTVSSKVHSGRVRNFWSKILPAPLTWLTAHTGSSSTSTCTAARRSSAVIEIVVCRATICALRSSGSVELCQSYINEMSRVLAPGGIFITFSLHEYTLSGDLGLYYDNERYDWNVACIQLPNPHRSTGRENAETISCIVCTRAIEAGVLQQQLNQFELPQFTKFRAEASDPAGRLKLEGMGLMKAAEHLKAAGTFTKALKKASAGTELHSELLLLRSRSLLKISKHAKALVDADACIAQYPELIDGYHCRLAILLEQGRAAEAFQQLLTTGRSELAHLLYCAAIAVRDQAAAAATFTMPPPEVIEFLKPTGEHHPYRVNTSVRMKRIQLEGKYCSGCDTQDAQALTQCERCGVAWFCSECVSDPEHDRWCRKLQQFSENQSSKAAAVAGGGVDLQLPARTGNLVVTAEQQVDDWSGYWELRADAVPSSSGLSRKVNQRLSTHHLTFPLTILYAAKLANVDLLRTDKPVSVCPDWACVQV